MTDHYTTYLPQETVKALYMTGHRPAKNVTALYSLQLVAYWTTPRGEMEKKREQKEVARAVKYHVHALPIIAFRWLTDLFIISRN